MSERSQTFPSAGAAPDGTVIYAIGDIHGELALLERLLTSICEDVGRDPGRKRVLVFVGDYIDRGPDSAGVVECVARDLPHGFDVHCLRGNHEQFLLAFLDDPATLAHWLQNGATETLMSYGIDPPSEHHGGEAFIRCRDAFAAALPEAHRSFLRQLGFYAELGDYLFVHAGIRPGVPLEQQSEHDLLWIREGFLDCDDDLGHVVVHGHTPGREPVVKPNRIGIDTGAPVYGCLTAVRLEGTSFEFLQVREGEE